MRRADAEKEGAASSATTEGEDEGGVRQLLGIKGAAAETNKWKVRLQLTKPVTWAPLVWGTEGGSRRRSWKAKLTIPAADRRICSSRLLIVLSSALIVIAYNCICR